MDINCQLEREILVALLQLVVDYGPTNEDVGFVTPASLPMARRNFKAKELKLFPYTRVIASKMPEKGMITELLATVSGSKPQSFFLAWPDRVANPTAEEQDSSVVSPFWNAAIALNESEVDRPSNLTLCRHDFAVTLVVKPKKSHKSQENWFGVSSEPGISKAMISLHFLNNPTAVKSGQTLRAPPGTVVQLVAD